MNRKERREPDRRDGRDGERRDSERRDERRDGGRDSDRRDGQPDHEHRSLSAEELQEGDSLTALKAILAKVAGLLKPLQLNSEESIRLVEQLYSTVLAMDLELAGEADDTRKRSVLAHIQNAVVRRDGDRIVVDYPVAQTPTE